MAPAFLLLSVGFGTVSFWGKCSTRTRTDCNRSRGLLRAVNIWNRQGPLEPGIVLVEGLTGLYHASTLNWFG